MKAAVFAAALCACAGAATAQDIILSNLPGSSSGTGSNLGVGTDLVDRTKAVGLTMGSESLDFVSLTALISNQGFGAPAPPTTLSGGIFSSVGGNPGVQLAAFDAVNIPSEFAPAEVSLSIAGGFTLQSGVSYWFVLDGPPVSNDLLWNSLASNAEPVPSGDITYDGYRFSSNGGGSWGSSGIFNGVRIEAIPAPSSAALLGLGGLVAARRRR